MSDGSNIGVTVGEALNKILGDVEPQVDNRLKTKEGMHLYLKGSHTVAEIEEMSLDQGYTEMSRYIGKLYLELFERHPEVAQAPNSPTYIKVGNEYKDQHDSVDDIADKFEPYFVKSNIFGLGVTGFMCGWGLNAAKFAFGVPPGSNSALVTFG